MKCKLITTQNHINLKWFAIKDLDDPKTAEACFRQLSSERKEKALQYRNESDQKRSIAAGWLLEQEFRKQYPDAPQEIEYKVSSHGKPHIAGYEKFYFSISHCKTHAVCAVSDSDVGIDAETIGDSKRNMKHLLTSRFFSEETKRWILEEDKKLEIRFLRIWTLAEALTKAADLPLMEVLHQLNPHDVRENTNFEYYFRNRKWNVYWQIANGCVVTVVF